MGTKPKKTAKGVSTVRKFKVQKDYSRRPRAGQPSAFERSPEKRANLIKLAKKGCGRVLSCRASRLSFTTLRSWEMDVEEKGEESPYYEWILEYHAAIAQGELKLLDELKDLGDEDWHSRAWVLERQYGYFRTLNHQGGENFSRNANKGLADVLVETAKAVLKKESKG